MNLFTDSVFGSILMLLSFVLALGLGIAVVVWIHGKINVDKLGVGLRYPLNALSAAVMIACPLLWIGYGPLKHYGELEGVSVRGQGRERTVSALFYSYNKSRRHETLRSFSLDGQVIASESLSRSFMGDKPRSLWAAGSVELMTLDDELKLVHVVSRKTLVALNPLLDERFGAGLYRFNKVQAEQLIIEQRDGKAGYVSLRELVAKELLEPVPTRHLWKDCRAVARASDRQAPLYELLRAHKLPCSVALSQPAQLILHRASAFGDDSDYQLSAVSHDGAAKLWTTDLSPVLGQELDRVGVYSPWLDGTLLCFWLVRDDRSLSEVCAQADTGELRSSKVVF